MNSYQITIPWTCTLKKTILAETKEEAIEELKTIIKRKGTDFFALSSSDGCLKVKLDEVEGDFSNYISVNNINTKKYRRSIAHSNILNIRNVGRMTFMEFVEKHDVYDIEEISEKCEKILNSKPSTRIISAIQKIIDGRVSAYYNHREIPGIDKIKQNIKTIYEKYYD